MGGTSTAGDIRMQRYQQCAHHTVAALSRANQATRPGVCVPSVSGAATRDYVRRVQTQILL